MKPLKRVLVFGTIAALAINTAGIKLLNGADIDGADTETHWGLSYVDTLRTEQIITPADEPLLLDEPIAREVFGRWLSTMLGQTAYDAGASVTITRTEAAGWIAKAFNLPPSDADILSRFTDYHELTDDAKDIFSQLVDAGIINGRGPESGTGLLDAQARLSCAEAAALLARASGDIFSIPGDYENSMLPGNGLINTSGVTLNEVSAAGHLLIAPGVGDGDTRLNRVSAQRLTIRGGGVNSVYLEYCAFDEISVCRSEGAIRVVAGDGNECPLLYVDDGCDAVFLSGPFEHVVIKTDTPVYITDGTIGTVTVTAENANITFESLSAVDYVNITPDALSASVRAEGTIGSMDVAADNGRVLVTGNLGQINITGEQVILEEPVSRNADDTSASQEAEDTRSDSNSRSLNTSRNRKSSASSGSSGPILPENGENDSNDNNPPIVTPPGGNNDDDDNNDDDANGEANPPVVNPPGGNDDGNDGDINNGSGGDDPPVVDPPVVNLPGHFEEALQAATEQWYTVVDPGDDGLLLAQGDENYYLPEQPLSGSAAVFAELFEALAEGDAVYLGSGMIREIALNKETHHITLSRTDFSMLAYDFTLTHNGQIPLVINGAGGSDRLTLSGTGTIAVTGINPLVSVNTTNLAGLDISGATSDVQVFVSGSRCTLIYAPNPSYRVSIRFKDNSLSSVLVEGVIIKGHHGVAYPIAVNKDSSGLSVMLGGFSENFRLSLLLNTGTILTLDGLDISLAESLAAEVKISGTLSKGMSLRITNGENVKITSLYRSTALVADKPNPYVLIEKTGSVPVRVTTDNFYNDADMRLNALYEDTHMGTYVWENALDGWKLKRGE